MRVQLFGIGLQGKSPVVSSQKRLNCYYEYQPVEIGGEDRTKVAVYGTSGLTLFVNLGAAPNRGMWQLGNFMYVVQGGNLWQINNAGTFSSRGTLSTTTGRVSITDDGVHLLIVDGTWGYAFNTGTNVFTRSDAFTGPTNFPANPTVCTFLATRFIVNNNNTGYFYISAANDPTTWATGNSAALQSNPFNISALIADHGQLVLFSNNTTEFWAPVGATDFPFASIGATTTEWGIAATWSLTKYNDSLIFLARNTLGEVSVATMSNNTIVPIPIFEWASVINGYSAVADATGFAYLLGNHPMYQINFPSAGYSWLYDASTGLPSQLQSNGITRHRADMFTNFLNTKKVGDYNNGNIYTLDTTAFTDNGDPILFQLVGKHVFKENKKISVARVQIDMETGVGATSGQGSNPQAMLRVSKDGGRVYGQDRWTSFGALGAYTSRAIWRRWGGGFDFVFDLRITDPVKRVIVGADMELIEGTN